MEKREGLPLVRFGLKEEKIYFNYAILAALDKPKYVQFLYEDKKKLLLIAGNNKKLPDSLAVPGEVYRLRMKDFRICHKHLIDAFTYRLRWDRSGNYSITGALHPQLKVVIFELAKATKTEFEQD
ncbi:hypothetical protein LJB90_02315 [Eubacteriales bacterium OttesenSCG-928-G02]|nr:hypothetical protein [Eubacteriales bacterium OttesenSCG-928-G02]